MESDSNQRVRRSRGDWQLLMERYESSGQSIAEFCKSESISQASFKKWRYHLSSRSRTASRNFIEVSSPQVSLGSNPELEIVYPSGMIVRIKR